MTHVSVSFTTDDRFNGFRGMHGQKSLKSVSKRVKGKQQGVLGVQSPRL